MTARRNPGLHRVEAKTDSIPGTARVTAGYLLPSEFHTLRHALIALGVDVAAFKTERQAAFFAQRALGTNYRFPQKGQSCRDLLIELQDHVASGVPIAAQVAVAESLGSEMGPAEVGARGLLIYTDGGASPNPGPGGWGFIAMENGQVVMERCGGQADSTNNQMEMMAALQALLWIRERGASGAVIRTDSTYLLGGATGSMKRRKNLDLWRDIDQAKAGLSVAFEWTRGHAGVAGNERADVLAGLGRRQAASM